MARKPNRCPDPVPMCEPMPVRPTSPPPPRRRKEACSNSCIAKQVELRANEKAAFFALREMSFDEMVRLSRIQIPWFWERVKFEVVLRYK